MPKDTSKGQLSLFNEEYLANIELMRKLLWPKHYEMVQAIRARHGYFIHAVRTSDLILELRDQGVETLEEAIRWSDQAFARAAAYE